MAPKTVKYSAPVLIIKITSEEAPNARAVPLTNIFKLDEMAACSERNLNYSKRNSLILAEMSRLYVNECIMNEDMAVFWTICF